MKTVLVADDDELLRELVVGILDDAGYRTLVAQDGAEAWDLLQSQGADMAVLDLNMPRLNGWELTQRIRSDARWQALPVLMLTVRALVEDQISGYERGADDYLTKPFDAAMLLARLRVLERRLPA